MNEPASDIRYLNRNEIDIDKWDNCIRLSPDGLIYARSFYLDGMAKNWSALILNDYEAVMPLTWNRNYGIKYLYQPPFTAQLGIFVKIPTDKNILKEFIQLARSHFSFCEMNLNASNVYIESPLRANYILDMQKPYIEISKGYQKRMLENLKKSETEELRFLHSDDYTKVIHLYKSLYGRRFPKLREPDYLNFEILCGHLATRKMILVREVKSIRNELLSANIFFMDNQRIYNIMPVTPEIGRDQKAQFYLLDQLIKEFASKNLLLDFEGSDVPGIAAFYRKFGPVNQPYPFLTFNHLPFPFRLFK